MEKDGQFCLNCFKAANFVTAPMCRVCGVPMPYDMADLCVHCAAKPPAFTEARAALRYDETARKLILPLKYADHTEAVSGLATLMRRPGEAMLQAANLLVPVPLHPARLRQRRFNQAALLAIALGRLTGRPLSVDALQRTRPTQQLEGLGAAQRREEVAGAFAVRAGAGLAGKRVVLIDDVMTSGATADACARALLDAGAKQVDVLTAARVADQRLDEAGLA